MAQKNKKTSFCLPSLDAFQTLAAVDSIRSNGNYSRTTRGLSCSQEAGSSSDTECGIIAIVAAGKTLQKMRKNQMGWRIQELQAVAEENFIEWRRPGRGGSHVIFSAPSVREIVSVPAKRPIKPVYIKQFAALIEAVGGIGTK